ncbi:MAG: hypothetical protein AABZ63_07510, partial [Actinomycetota bacterium]
MRVLIIALALAGPPAEADEPESEAAGQRFNELMRSQDHYPPFGIPPCPTCATTKTGLPAIVDWSPYVPFWRDGHNQNPTPRCGTFAAVGQMEVQYAINNCDRHGVPICDPLSSATPCPTPCIADATNDDPHPDGPWTPHGWNYGEPIQLDLSEQLVINCSRQGYFFPHLEHDGVTDFRFLAFPGTTLEELAPWRLPYEAYGTYDFWPPPGAPFAPDPMWGTCPLANRGHPVLFSYPPVGERETFPDGIVDLEEISDWPGTYHTPLDPSYVHAPMFVLIPGLGMDMCAYEYPPEADPAWPPECDIGTESITAAEAPWALARGYVLGMCMNWSRLAISTDPTT